eukprot:TRINITY_DN63_c2_g1_i5.p1 TRINITY_DN63_c2_g1~~TRINITY_DN63_c2_g1_i5.p1  ORF type:complete len:161 (+),score=34.44 TRINITY_DN63_c2_g1_i5:61-543(+)
MANRRRLDRDQSSVELNDDQTQELQALFNLLTNGKPKLDRDTLKNDLSKFGIRDARVEEMLKEADPNNDGSIDFMSFSQMMSRKMAKSVSEDDMRAAFRKFDWKKTGQIATAELAEALTSFGKPPLTTRELSEMLAVCEKDGQVNYEAFLKNMFSKEGEQ